MHIQRLPLTAAAGHVLPHTIVDPTGKRLLRKGIRLSPADLAQLQALGYAEIEVAVLDAADIWEDLAAAQLVEAMRDPALEISWGVGGRANLHTTISGVVYVDALRLEQLNTLPGITLATAPPYSVVHPQPRSSQRQPAGGDPVASLKIIPYAVSHAIFQQAQQIIAGPPLVAVHALGARRVALLLTGAAGAHAQLQRTFEPPLRARVEALHGQLECVRVAAQDEAAISLAVRELAAAHDVILMAGQTSIIDSDDVTLRALRRAGADDIIHGAPVDPGSLLALGYVDGTPILCAPGCARSRRRNVIDLVLPRLFAGERLTAAAIAQLGLGGLLGR